MWQEIRNGVFQDELTCKTPYLVLRRNLCGEFNERVIKKRYTALDRRCHAHLILLHQQFDEIAVQIRVEQTMHQIARGALPDVDRRAIGSSGRVDSTFSEERC